MYNILILPFIFLFCLQYLIEKLVFLQIVSEIMVIHINTSIAVTMPVPQKIWDIQHKQMLKRVRLTTIKSNLELEVCGVVKDARLVAD